MMVIIRIAIVLGLACAVVDFYAAARKGNNPLHMAAHIAFGCVFLGLVCLIWMLK